MRDGLRSRSGYFVEIYDCFGNVFRTKKAGNNLRWLFLCVEPEFKNGDKKNIYYILLVIHVQCSMWCVGWKIECRRLKGHLKRTNNFRLKVNMNMKWSMTKNHHHSNMIKIISNANHQPMTSSVLFGWNEARKTPQTFLLRYHDEHPYRTDHTQW